MGQRKFPLGKSKRTGVHRGDRALVASVGIRLRRAVSRAAAAAAAADRNRHLQRVGVKNVDPPRGPRQHNAARLVQEPETRDATVGLAWNGK